MSKVRARRGAKRMQSRQEELALRLRRRKGKKKRRKKGREINGKFSEFFVFAPSLL